MFHHYPCCRHESILAYVLAASCGCISVSSFAILYTELHVAVSQWVLMQCCISNFMWLYLSEFLCNVVYRTSCGCISVSSHAMLCIELHVAVSQWVLMQCCIPNFMWLYLSEFLCNVVYRTSCGCISVSSYAMLYIELHVAVSQWVLMQCCTYIELLVAVSQWVLMQCCISNFMWLYVSQWVLMQCCISNFMWLYLSEFLCNVVYRTSCGCISVLLTHPLGRWSAVWRQFIPFLLSHRHRTRRSRACSTTSRSSLIPSTTQRSRRRDCRRKTSYVGSLTGRTLGPWRLLKSPLYAVLLPVLLAECRLRLW